MRLEIHTFDPELLAVLMGRDTVKEGDELPLADGSTLRYERTFGRRVKHFPLILHFSVEIRSESGPADIAEWLFDRAGRRNIEKVLVDYQDARLDASLLQGLLQGGI